MRTKKSIKNSVAAVVVNLSTMIIGFVAQAVFIRILGAEYLGLNGLFNNILYHFLPCVNSTTHLKRKFIAFTHHINTFFY